MKLRSFFSVLIAAVLVLLLIGGGGWLWLFAQSPLTLLVGRQAAPAAVMFVPRQAPAMVSLLVNPDRLEALRQVIATPGSRRRSRSELNQLKQNLLTSAGLDYQQDIQPWLGEEITLAVTTFDIDRQLSNGQQPGYLLVLETRDAEQSQRFLQRFWKNQGEKLVSEQYQGVKLISANPEITVAQPNAQNDATKLTATAMVGDRFVLFANHPKVLRGAINNVQVPELGLKQAADYQRALTSFRQGWVGLGFLNVSQLAGERQVGVTAPPDLRLAIAFGLHRQGILAETALVTGAEDDQASPQPTYSGQVLDYVPASSPLVVSGTGLDQLWRQATKLLDYDRLANLVNRPLRDLKTSRGLDLPQDIFAWVKGEYAIGLLPHPALGRDRPQPDWLFLAETTDAEQAEQAIHRLDTVAAQQGLGVGPLGVAEGKISAWTQLTATTPQLQSQPQSQVERQVEAGLLQARVLGAHGTVANCQVMATSLAAVDSALNAADNALRTSDTFKAAIAPLPAPRDGYLYLDWPASRPLVEQQFPLLKAVEVIGRPFFRHLRSLALGGYGTKAGVYQGRLFLRLAENPLE